MKKKVDDFFNRIFETVQGIRDTHEMISKKVKLGLHSGNIIKSLNQLWRRFLQNNRTFNNKRCF